MNLALSSSLIAFGRLTPVSFIVDMFPNALHPIVLDRVF